MSTKNNFFYFFVYYLPLPLPLPFKSVLKDNKLLRSYKTVEIKVFLIYLLVDGSGHVKITDPDLGSRIR